MAPADRRSRCAASECRTSKSIAERYMSRRILAGLIVLAIVVSGCAAGRAFRRGQDAVRAGDWDAAVTHFTKALQENPDSAEYKLQLQRAQEEASRMHIERARDLEQKDQLD